MITIVATSDTHSEHRNIFYMPKGDILIHAGDACRTGTKEDLKDFANWFSQQPFKHKIYVPGNHDIFAHTNPTEARRLFAKDVNYLHEDTCEVLGLKIFGAGYVMKTTAKAFGRPAGTTLRNAWRLIEPGTDVVVTHTPAYGILDTTKRKGEHAGCPDLTERLRQLKPRVHICGHIHEGYGAEVTEGTQHYNVAYLNPKQERVMEIFLD